MQQQEESGEVTVEDGRVRVRLEFAKLKPQFEMSDFVYVARYTPVPASVDVEELRHAFMRARNNTVEADGRLGVSAERKMKVTYEMQDMVPTTRERYTVTFHYFPYAGKALMNGCRQDTRHAEIFMKFQDSVVRHVCSYMHEGERCRGFSRECHCATGDDAELCMSVVAKMKFRARRSGHHLWYDVAGIGRAYNDLWRSGSQHMIHLKLPVDQLPDKVHRTRQHSRVARMALQGQETPLHSHGGEREERRMDDALSQINLFVSSHGSVTCMGARSAKHAKARLEEIFETMLRPFLFFITDADFVAMMQHE